MEPNGYHQRTLTFPEQINMGVVNMNVNTNPLNSGLPPHMMETQSLPQMDDMTSQAFCAICGDKATGKHYGANSCDGCKGFFRRSVRKNHSYSCRFNRNCVIDKDKRNQCRYCRLRKCFRAGMKKAAVQNERDKISNRRASFDDPPATNLITIATIMQAEQRQQELYTQMQGSQGQNGQLFGQKLAALDDVCDSMHSQLLLLVEWAKSVQCFQDIVLNDQIALLQAHAGEMLILGVVWRSILLGQEDGLVLGNNFVISRDSNEPDIANVACHILDQLFHPLREIQMDDVEFACLKAMVFFDPNVAKLSEASRHLIRVNRHRIQLDLMNHMNDKQYSGSGRFGELLLLLPDLRTITQMMVQKVQFANLMGFAKIDVLLNETLLAASGIDLNSNYSNHTSSSQVSSSQTHALSAAANVSQPSQSTITSMHNPSSSIQLMTSSNTSTQGTHDAYNSAMLSEHLQPGSQNYSHIQNQHPVSCLTPLSATNSNFSNINPMNAVHFNDHFLQMQLLNTMSDSAGNHVQSLNNVVGRVENGSMMHISPDSQSFSSNVSSQSEQLHYTNLEPAIFVHNNQPIKPAYNLNLLNVQNQSRSLPSSPQRSISYKLSPISSPKNEIKQHIHTEHVHL